MALKIHNDATPVVTLSFISEFGIILRTLTTGFALHLQGAFDNLYGQQGSILFGWVFRMSKSR